MPRTDKQRRKQVKNKKDDSSSDELSGSSDEEECCTCFSFFNRRPVVTAPLAPSAIPDSEPPPSPPSPPSPPEPCDDATIDALLGSYGIRRSELAAVVSQALPGFLKARGMKLGPRLRLQRLLQQARGGDGAAGTAEDISDVDRASLTDLCASECERLLEDLLAAYREPPFVASLSALHALPGSGVIHGVRVAGPTNSKFGAAFSTLVLSAQARVLPKYGLSPDASGVARMRKAVHRRMIEQQAAASHGQASRLHTLSNEARRVLGLTGLRDMTVYESAEHLAAKQLSGEVMPTIGGLTVGPDAATMRQTVRAAADASRISSAHAAYLERQLDASMPPLAVRTLLALAETGLSCDSLDPRHTASLVGPVAEVAAVPSAVAFHADFVLPGRPLVMRGVLRAGWPPLSNLASFDYWRRRCGHRRVLVKTLGISDTRGRRHFVSDPELSLPLVDFLAAVETSERDGTSCPFYLGKVPLRDELPELMADLDACAASAPFAPLLDCFGPLIPQGVHTYFGAGNQVTSTHFDPNENLISVISGTKRLWLYPPSDAPFLCANPAGDPSRVCAPPFQRLDELPEHLRASFVDVAHAKGPMEVTLHAGDLFYLPVGWWHCVEGSRERNMILNYWLRVPSAKREPGLDMQAHR